MSMCAIIGILLKFRGRALSDRPYRIKLNTLVSIFAQISSTALVVSLSECISQLKWLWFAQRNQPLSDFDTFDEASRGPLSSVVLIWKTRASIPPFTVASVYAGMNGGVELSQVIPTCPTGNCTWSPYNSLALCANPVANLTHSLNVTNAYDGSPMNGSCALMECKYSLPNGLSLAPDSSGAMTVVQVASLSLNGTNVSQRSSPSNLTSIAFSDIPVVLDFFMIYSDQSYANVAALEASLSFCGQTYNRSVAEGKVNTTELDRWGSLDTRVAAASSEPIVNWPIVGNSTTLWVEEAYVDSLQYTLSSIFSGTYTIQVGGTAETQLSSVAVQALNNTIGGSLDDVAAFQSFMDDLAVSISNNFRTGVGSTTVNGANNSLQTYISVDWYWLIFPCFMLLFAMIFLLVTIAKNHARRGEAWKSSSIAVLSGLSSDAKAKLGDLTFMTSMQERAKEIRVRLVEENGHWQLVAA
ncbi:uncharacterized protein LY89DRAFT_720369 [Mollisia scopiformis]|uniref:Uncharacterized protein n=1 Tax=Mollisia scopiformis TaxID=149040 RepID=A0A194X445_MOLSC|nr:uncharacterized protein LY89DRAFT_720369 [Mollisia scopiformis]KUJ14941.1 hypothetical protein LY89DRAFT_720369 [Mollisia scopiformis]